MPSSVRSTGFFLQSRQKFIEPYSYLFTKRDQEVTEEQERRLISDEEAFAEEFSWYPMLYTAAGEKYLDINKVVESRADEFLTFMNFYKRKCELDSKRINNHKH